MCSITLTPRSMMRLAIVAIVLGASACAPRVKPVERGAPRSAQVVQRATRSAERTEPPAVAFDTIARIDAPIGGAFLIPLDPAMLRTATRAPRVLLDDGLELPTTLHMVTLHPATHAQGDSWSRWLGPTYQWKSSPVTFEESRSLAQRADSGGVGFALHVEPKSGRTDSACWLLDQRVPMQWLPSIETLALRAPTVKTGPWGPTLPAQVRQYAPLRALIERERSNPLTRWRARLLDDGLAPDVKSAPYDDPVLEALASQHEHRMRVALARLWMAAPDLCERIKQRLSAVAIVGDGVGVPLWETRPEQIDRLVLDLCNSHFTDSHRVQLAEQWLASQPPAVAWVVDDAGTLASSREGTIQRALASVAIVNLGESARLAWIAPARGNAPANLDPLEPYMATVRIIRAPSPERRGVFDIDSSIRAHVGEWSHPLGLLLVPVPVTPPGLRTTVFEVDQTLATLLAGAAAVPEEAWSTAALLHKPAPTGSADATTRNREWELYVECRTPAGKEADARESLFVYAGPIDRPAAAWRITPDGQVRSLREQDRAVEQELGMGATVASVSRGADRWVMRVPLPPGAIEERGLVRLSLVRVDSRGVRQTWPRAMMPWSVQPSRALLDLRAWESGSGTDADEP